MAARRQDLSRRVFRTPMRTCFHSMALAALGAVALTGCPGDPARPPEQEPPAWRVLLDEGDLDRAVLSIWETAPDDVFAVGGRSATRAYKALAAPGRRGEVARAPGGRGLRPSGGWPAPVRRTFRMVGEAAVAPRGVDGATFTEHATGTEATLWGVIAFSPDDAWALVGGMPAAAARTRRRTSSSAGRQRMVARAAAGGDRPGALQGMGRIFRGSHAVGEFGVIWHRSGSTWEVHRSADRAGHPVHGRRLQP